MRIFTGSSCVTFLTTLLWCGSFSSVSAQTVWTTQVSGLAAVNTSELIAATWTGTRFVAVGHKGSGSTVDAVILTSTDGITWTEQPTGLTGGGTRSLSAALWTGNQVVTVGYGPYSPSGQQALILTSPNGSTWTSRTPGTTQTTNYALSSLTWSGAKITSVGNNNNGVVNAGVIESSVDGVTWTPQDVGTPVMGSRYLNAVVWIGNKLVAVGDGGKAFTSPDGVTWTAQNTNTSFTLKSLAWTGSQIVAVGFNNGGSNGSAAILTSPDGVTWTTRAPGTQAFLWSVVWAGNQLVAVGSDGLLATKGVVLTSTDGITWAFQNAGTLNTLLGITASGTQLVATGENGTILTSPIVPVVSITGKTEVSGYVKNASLWYRIPKKSAVELRLFDLRGNEVFKSSQGVRDPGYYSCPLAMKDLNQGAYFLNIRGAGFNQSVKVMVAGP